MYLPFPRKSNFWFDFFLCSKWLAAAKPISAVQSPFPPVLDNGNGNEFNGDTKEGEEVDPESL